MPKARNGSPGSGTASCFRAAVKQGLRVFGGFFAVAAGFFVLTFMWFRRLDGPLELPLPEWIMLLPALALLEAGVRAGLIVTAVDLRRARSPHLE